MMGLARATDSDASGPPHFMRGTLYSGGVFGTFSLRSGTWTMPAFSSTPTRILAAA